MLVGNKLDMAGQRKTPRALGEQFAQEEGLLFIESSAKTGEGVEDLFMEIGRSGQAETKHCLTPTAKKLPLTQPKAGASGVKVAPKPEQTPRACTC